MFFLLIMISTANTFLRLLLSRSSEEEEETKKANVNLTVFTDMGPYICEEQIVPLITFTF